MKVLKRNQLIVLVVSLMLITAGYLNFTANNNEENVQTSTIADRDDETIGDAQLVSTVPSENEEDIVENLISGEGNSQDSSSDTENSMIVDNTTPTSSVADTESDKENSNNINQDFYFTTSKLERNTMYSELLETYQEMYNNSNASNDEKSKALEKINEINNTKNGIMIAENLITAKGFEDAVIFVNEGSISVIIKADELKEEQVAQIQNIVSRELNAKAESIHISNK